MKSIKQLICGVLIGALATISITALAEYVINPNPYPVKVNGQEVQIEGYNINDSTYFKLRDISAVVEGINVDFKDGMVTIDTTDATPAPEPSPAAISQIPPEATELSPALSGYYRKGYSDGLTSDGIPYKIIDGVKYISTADINIVYDLKAKGYEFGVRTLYDKDNNRVVDNMIVSDEHYDIEYTYYETVLRPWLQAHCK